MLSIYSDGGRKVRNFHQMGIMALFCATYKKEAGSGGKVRRNAIVFLCQYMMV